MSPRPLLSAVVFAALIVVSARVSLLKFPFVDREPSHRALTIWPDGGAWSPDYPQFLRAIRQRTSPGDTIALVVPVSSWEGGYSYAYYRGSYFLAGRQLLPVLTPGDRRVPQNLNRAQYVAIWPGKPPAGVKVVFAGFGGALVRR